MSKEEELGRAVKKTVEDFGLEVQAAHITEVPSANVVCITIQVETDEFDRVMSGLTHDGFSIN